MHWVAARLQRRVATTAAGAARALDAFLRPDGPPDFAGQLLREVDRYVDFRLRRSEDLVTRRVEMRLAEFRKEIDRALTRAPS